MEVLIIVIGISIWAYAAYKKKLGYYQKMTVKGVLAYVAVGLFGFSVIALLVSVVGVLGVFYEDTIAERQDNYASYCSNGEFDSLSMMMYYDQSYEEEFDYLWEQVDMYDTYNRYQIYMKAAEQASDKTDKDFYMEKALECKKDLLDICRESTFEENILYAEYYGTVVWE